MISSVLCNNLKQICIFMTFKASTSVQCHSRWQDGSGPEGLRLFMSNEVLVCMNMTNIVYIWDWTKHFGPMMLLELWNGEAKAIVYNFEDWVNVYQYSKRKFLHILWNWYRWWAYKAFSTQLNSESFCYEKFYRFRDFPFEQHICNVVRVVSSGGVSTYQNYLFSNQAYRILQKQIVLHLNREIHRRWRNGE